MRGDDENLLRIGVKTDRFRLPGREVVIPAQAGIHPPTTVIPAQAGIHQPTAHSIQPTIVIPA